MSTIAAAAEIRTDIEYSRAGGMSLRLDASVPEGSGPFRAAVIVHGGGWIRGDRPSSSGSFGPFFAAGMSR